LLIFGKLLW
jgi:hypothetical protein